MSGLIVDPLAARAATHAPFPTPDTAPAIGPMLRYRHSLPSGSGKMHNRAATRILVRRMFEIPIAVVRWRARRNSQTPFPASAALVS